MLKAIRQKLLELDQKWKLAKTKEEKDAIDKQINIYETRWSIEINEQVKKDEEEMKRFMEDWGIKKRYDEMDDEDDEDDDE